MGIGRVSYDHQTVLAGCRLESWGTLGAGSRSSNTAYTHHVTTIYTDTTESGKGAFTYHPRQEQPGCKGQLNTIHRQTDGTVTIIQKQTTNTLTIQIIDQTETHPKILQSPWFGAIIMYFALFRSFSPFIHVFFNVPPSAYLPIYSFMLMYPLIISHHFCHILFSIFSFFFIGRSQPNTL